MVDQVPALPLTLKIKQGKLVINYGKYEFKLKPINKETGEYSGLLLTKFLWDTTQELWDAEMNRQETISDVKKSFLGIEDAAADGLVQKIHDDLFGGQ